MLGLISRFGSAKGMVAMPNLSGLTRGQAIEAIRNSGLTFLQETATSTNNSALDNRVAQQSVLPGTLIDYESPISFVYSIFVAPAAPSLIDTVFGNCVNSGTASSSSACSGTTLITTFVQPRARSVTYVYSDGSQAFGSEVCSSIVSSSSIQNSVSCGYVPPAPTCTASCGSYSWSACSGGVQIGTRTCTASNCSSFVDTTSRTCCTASCGSWSSFSSCSSGRQSRTRTCTRSDCSTFSQSESRCCSSTTFGAWSVCSGGRRSRAVFTYSSNCSVSSSTQFESCGGGSVGGGGLIAL